MKRRIAAVMLLGFVACSNDFAGPTAPAPSFAADNATTTDTFDWSVVWFSGCTNEDVSLQGIFRTTYQLRWNDIGYNLRAKYTLKITGMGLASGLRYEGMQFGSLDVDIGPGDTYYDTTRFRMATQGSALNDMINIVIAYRVTPGGKLVHEVDSINEWCRGTGGW